MRPWNSDCFRVEKGTEIKLIDQRKGESLLEVEERARRFENWNLHWQWLWSHLMQNLKVKGDNENVKAVETRCVRIEVRRFKKFGEGRINTMGWSGNKTDQYLIYWKSKIHWGINMTRSMESSGSTLRTKNKNAYLKVILMRCVEVELML